MRDGFEAYPGQSRLFNNRSVFFNVFTPPIGKRPVIHASIMVFSHRKRRAIGAFHRSVLGFPARSASDHFRRANSAFTSPSAFSISPSCNSASSCCALRR